MAKYIISTNLEKLPAEVLSVLLENGCSIEKLNNVTVAADTVAPVSTPASTDNKGELIASLMILKNNTFTRDEANDAIDHISKGEYSEALKDISYMATWQDNLKRRHEAAYDAFIKASNLIGGLV